MKKILVLALAIVMAFSVVALVACDQGETYDGECKLHAKTATYESYYGCKVTVTVKGGVITNVKLWSDEDFKAAAGQDYHRTTPTWLSAAEADEYNKAHPNEKAKFGVGLGFKTTEARYEAWLKATYEGKSVEDAKKITASATEKADGELINIEYVVGTESTKASILKPGDDKSDMTGATQSIARVIVAVQDALSKIPAAK